MKKLLLIFSTVTFFVLTFTAIGVFNHELTHGAIYHDYGCENVSYNWILTEDSSNLAEATATCSIPTEKMNRLKLVQDNVEASGYQIGPLYSIAGLIFGFLILILTKV
jgi:hypothetical protein